MHGPEMTWNRSLKMIALLINWEFVILTLAHLNKDDAEVVTNNVRSNESLKAQQSPADLERLYLRAADAHEDDCERYVNTLAFSSDPADDSTIQSTFKCHACEDHSLVNNADQNGANPSQNDAFEEILRGPVTWRFLRDQQNLNGVVVSDDSQPVFTCGKEHLWIKFSMMRHSNPRLIIKPEWADSQKQCRCIRRNHGPSMLLRIYFKDCYASNWTRDRRMYYSVGVLYFDHLQMKSLSGIATCHAAILPHDAPSTEESPEVICGKPFVIVKLPAKRIKSVKVLGMSRQLPRAVLWKSHHTVLVKLKRSAVEDGEDGILQLDYLDVTGKLQTFNRNLENIASNNCWNNSSYAWLNICSQNHNGSNYTFFRNYCTWLHFCWKYYPWHHFCRKYNPGHHFCRNYYTWHNFCRNDYDF
ncbi:uncharacterized protein LOC107732169 [Sinocyclocheilus rhinocerous]|uniref:uncharacterized protein LOC107732169 n=1 Tax=Sinocyclocheilus rhinocerous TaxID=307959 RepID=UPI0007B927EB|nr:PREDICTED: uncharacterized protein LOC107732169 [Sinocyclocheilus rhinocerous]